jgi:uncharacterized protein (DUF433 family)
MTTAVTYPHLTIDEHGTARIGDTRYKVQHLAAEHYYYGWSAEELLKQHPDLRPAEVHAALVYFYDHYDAMVARIEETAAYVERVRTAQPLSRDELMRRYAARGE